MRMTEDDKKAKRDAAGKQGNPLFWVIDLLASLKFALLIVIAIAVACIVGTLLPQGTQVANTIAANPAAEARMQLLTTLGLTRVFTCGWFIGLLCLLALSLTVCTARRCQAFTRVQDNNARIRIAGSIVTHISLLLILAGGVIRGVWGHKGTLALREGQTAAAFETATGRIALPFSVHLVDFTIEYHEQEQNADKTATDETGMGTLVYQWRGGGPASELPVELGREYLVSHGDRPEDGTSSRIKFLNYVPDFVVDSSTRAVKSRSDVPRNPAIQVEVAGEGGTHTFWLFARFPEFNTHGAAGRDASQLELSYSREVVAPDPVPQQRAIKDFKSTLQLIEGGAVVMEKTIEVNAPLSRKGYTLYQAGYNPADMRYTSLQVVHDPGVRVVYAGFVLIIVGLTLVFYVSPMLTAPKTKSGESS